MLKKMLRYVMTLTCELWILKKTPDTPKKTSGLALVKTEKHLVLLKRIKRAMDGFWKNVSHKRFLIKVGNFFCNAAY